nr:transcription factor Spt20 [Tanacetum cinerariifolium]
VVVVTDLWRRDDGSHGGVGCGVVAPGGRGGVIYRWVCCGGSCGGSGVDGGSGGGSWWCYRWWWQRGEVAADDVGTARDGEWGEGSDRSEYVESDNTEVQVKQPRSVTFNKFDAGVGYLSLGHLNETCIGNQDGQSSFMANADNRNQSEPLAIVGNRTRVHGSYIQNNTSSQTAANVPRSSSTQGTVSLSSDDDIEGNDCSPMANNADNKQQQHIAANQQHDIVISGSDDDDLWSFMSAFDNKRGHQDGQPSSMAKRKRLNPLAFNGNQLQQMAGSSHNTLVQQQSAGGVIQHPNNAITPTLVIGRDSDRLHPSFPPQLTRSTFVQAPWNKSPGEFSSGSMEIITIEDDEPVQRRSSSSPPKPPKSSSGAARRQYRAAPRSSSVHAFCRHLCQHHVPSTATAAIVSVICQVNDHDFDGLGGFSALDLYEYFEQLSFFDGEAWMPCVKGLSSVCLLAFKIIPSCLLLAAFIANVATHGRSAIGVGEVDDGPRHKKEPVEFSSGSMEMQFGAVGSSRRRQKSVFASVPAIGGRQPIEIITIEDDESVQRRSSSRPPKLRESSSGAARRQYRAAARLSSVHAVGGSQTSSSNTNNSMHPTQMAATPRSKPLPTIHILSGIRSSSSTIGNTSGLSNVSASVQRELDRRTHDRFTKIGLLTARYGIFFCVITIYMVIC